MTVALLPEQRFQQRIAAGGRGVRHVLRLSTTRAGTQPGLWTRRAADRRALCGSLRALVVGIDAIDWPTELEPLGADSDSVTCQRCMARYLRWQAEREVRP